jgi:hypothetical protein
MKLLFSFALLSLAGCTTSEEFTRTFQTVAPAALAAGINAGSHQHYTDSNLSYVVIPGQAPMIVGQLPNGNYFVH